MVKRTNAAGSWMIFDTTRNPTNPIGLRLNEQDANKPVKLRSLFQMTFSNGFKFRNTGSAYNDVGETYIYCSFAENPFGGNNVSPANAR